jgi:hypothetical protein
VGKLGWVEEVLVDKGFIAETLKGLWMGQGVNCTQGAAVVLFDTNVMPLAGNKPAISPMTFTLIPPNEPADAVPPSNKTTSGFYMSEERSKTVRENYWNKSDPLKTLYFLSQRAAGQGTNSNLQLDNLRSDQDLVTNACATMRDTPPLVLLINPASFNNDNSKIIADSAYTRNGNRIEHWGDNLLSITCEGVIGAYYTVTPNFFGVSRSLKAISLSYQNLMALTLMYLNNGYIFVDPVDGRRISKVGSVMMSYDGNAYIGHFNNFTTSDKAEAPYNLSYSFEFTPTSTYDTGAQ